MCPHKDAAGAMQCQTTIYVSAWNCIFVCAYILGFQYKNTNTDAAGAQVITDCNLPDFNGSSVALLAVEGSMEALLRLYSAY